MGSTARFQLLGLANRQGEWWAQLPGFNSLVLLIGRGSGGLNSARFQLIGLANRQGRTGGLNCQVSTPWSC